MRLKDAEKVPDVNVHLEETGQEGSRGKYGHPAIWKQLLDHVHVICMTTNHRIYAFRDMIMIAHER